MNTSLEHVYELEPQVKVARARSGVLLLIISDALFVVAIMAGSQYLRALNTEGQYRIAGDYAPSFVAGLLVMIGLLLSGLAFYLWDRRASKAGETGQSLFFLLSLLIMLAAAVGETWFTAVHLWLAAIIGILLGGRILRGRVTGHEFVAEVTGYWWYYTVVASILLWLFATYLT